MLYSVLYLLRKEDKVYHGILDYFQVRTVAADYIMKCDDDTFVRIDAVLKEVKNARNAGSLYVGNINYYHRPLRHGKWAVTYEVYLFHFLNLKDQKFIRQYNRVITSSLHIRSCKLMESLMCSKAITISYCFSNCFGSKYILGWDACKGELIQLFMSLAYS